MGSPDGQNQLSPGNLLEMHIMDPHSRGSPSVTGSGAQHLLLTSLLADSNAH